ncbi:LpqN/LpqT family lipoprotein [Mycobacterium sp.]|jgi:hypothetical protein|uniref:LpqN/LpqT family lipoprotein n=1 Tax=Mycobacterium sp. TaxID=1785 RepID=UPI002D688A88|nr:LpqN/LpqT family lipoprotein [Mycobacterium sp.]HZA11831.1 LpqN/LpqT family lipoprotein [Mycobacterium sp.]
MIDRVRAWLAVAGAAAAGVAGVAGLSGAHAGAEPTLPIPPAPATVTQAVTATPAAGAGAPVAVAPTANPWLPQAANPGLPQAANPGLPPAVPALTPATSGTLTDFFNSKSVKLDAQRPQDFKALTITLPMPAGWSQVPDPNVPDAFLVIANRAGGDGLYTPNAQVVVYKLSGDFDPLEAITHGFVDSQQLPSWKTTGGALTDFGGFPSARIEGTYRSNEETLNTFRRHIIAASGADKYLVSLSVTTSAAQAVAFSDATDAIVNGFRVTAAAPPAAAAPRPGSP